MSNTRSAFMPGAASATAIERWSLPEVEGNVIGRPVDDKKAKAAAEAIARVQREQSEKKGYDVGVAKAQSEMSARIVELDNKLKRMDSLLQFIARPLQDLDAEVENMLTQLALSVGKQLARRELRVDPTQVIAIIRESLAELPAASREIKVQLHPDDAAIVRERLTAPVSERAWVVVEDPTMSRGGCVVRAEHSRVDARLESRISTIIANAFGDERASDREAAAESQAADAESETPTGPNIIGTPLSQI
jgi:flagellar assembly protein FliH